MTDTPDRCPDGWHDLDECVAKMAAGTVPESATTGRVPLPERVRVMADQLLAVDLRQLDWLHPDHVAQVHAAALQLDELATLLADEWDHRRRTDLAEAAADLPVEP